MHVEFLTKKNKQKTNKKWGKDHVSFQAEQLHICVTVMCCAYVQRILYVPSYDCLYIHTYILPVYE